MSFTIGDIGLGPTFDAIKALDELYLAGLESAFDIATSEGEVMPDGAPAEARTMLKSPPALSPNATRVLRLIAGGKGDSARAESDVLLIGPEDLSDTIVHVEAYDPNQRRWPKGTPKAGQWMKMGLSAKEYEAEADSVAAGIREEAPLPAPWREDTTAKQKRYAEQMQGIGEAARAVIEQKPEVVDADRRVEEAQAAYREVFFDKRGRKKSLPDVQNRAATQEHQDRAGRAVGNLKRAYREAAEARAAAVQDFLKRVRPTGETANVPLRAHGPDDQLVATVVEEARMLPAGWIAGMNSYFAEGADDLMGSNPGVEVIESDTHGEAYSPAWRLLKLHADEQISSRATLADYRDNPTAGRLHELVHAVQAATSDTPGIAGIGLGDHAWNAHRNDQRPLRLGGDELVTALGEQGDLYFDRYSLRGYERPQFTEVSSTGIEYLVGGTRSYSADTVKISPETYEYATPWDYRFRNHLNYSLGLLLKGGDKEAPEEYDAAGIKQPQWLIDLLPKATPAP